MRNLSKALKSAIITSSVAEGDKVDPVVAKEAADLIAANMPRPEMLVPLSTQIVRILLFVVGGYLAGKGYGTSESWQQFTENAVNLLGVAMPLVAALWWSAVSIFGKKNG